MSAQTEIHIPIPPSSFAASPEVVALLKPYLAHLPREQHERWMKPMSLSSRVAFIQERCGASQADVKRLIDLWAGWKE